MTEHESNLLDLYAGFAMLGMVMKGSTPNTLLATKAWAVATNMIKERSNAIQSKEGEEDTSVSDMAVSDMEGREDSDPKGIAALEKTKAKPN